MPPHAKKPTPRVDFSDVMNETNKALIEKERNAMGKGLTGKSVQGVPLRVTSLDESE